MLHVMLDMTGKNYLIPKMTTAFHNFFQKTYKFLEPHSTQVIQENLDGGLTNDDDEYVLNIIAFWTKMDMYKKIFPILNGLWQQMQLAIFLGTPSRRTMD